MTLGAALALLALASAGAARAEEAEAPVGTITYRTLNVFNLEQPEDNWWPFVIANRLHRVTRPAVVSREMLLEPGAPFDPIKAIETERNLRSLGFIRHASVLPAPRADGAVDLQVRTQDSWTLQPQMSVGTEGGETSYVLGVSEGNILGLGKQASAFHSRSGNRRRNELRYGDPRLVGTEARLLTHFADTDRGNEVGVRLHRPFYSHDSPWAAEASWAKVAQDETLYRDASQVNEFLHDYRSARALGSRRLTQGSGPVQRGGLGWRFERSRFEPQAKTLPGTLPSRRTLSGPLAAYALIEPRYLKAVDIDRMKVIEDFNLGWELGVEGSPLLSATGSDRDRWALGASLQKGIPLGEGRFALAHCVTESRLAGGRIDNGILTGSLNLFWQTTMRFRQTFVTHAEYTATKGLDGERRLNLGGDTGLRGYRNNSFQGARVMTVNLEDRLFFDRNVMRLMYFGAVAFIEAGSAIPEGARFAHAPWKADLGLGLRISSSRSAAGGVLRIDGAYALNRGPGASRWVLTLKGGQAFSIGGSANKPLLRKPDAVLADDSASDRLRRR